MVAPRPLPLHPSERAYGHAERRPLLDRLEAAVKARDDALAEVDAAARAALERGIDYDDVANRVGISPATAYRRWRA